MGSSLLLLAAAPFNGQVIFSVSDFMEALPNYSSFRLPELHALSGKSSSSSTQGAASLPVNITPTLSLHLLAKMRGWEAAGKGKETGLAPFGAESLSGCVRPTR